MKIIKKKKGLFGITIINLEHEDNLLMVLMNYNNNGIYEFEIYLATSPQKKNKGWQKIDYKVDYIDDYSSIDTMICCCTARVYEKYCKKSKQDFERIKKWKEFEKTLDK